MISGDATSVPRAARRLGVSRQGVQRIANNLVDDGLAQWRPNPDHRSSPLLELTAAGRRALSSITDRASAAQRSLTADIEADDIRTARKVLQRLTAAVRQLE